MSSWPHPDPNFRLATRALNAAGVIYYVGHGSLLGLTREKTLIPWDPDIDICIPAETSSIELVQRALTEAGFDLVSSGYTYHFAKKGGRKIDINMYEKTERLGPDGEVYAAESIFWSIDDPKSITNFLYRLVAGLHDALANKTTYPDFVRRQILSFFSLSERRSNLFVNRLRAWLEPKRRFTRVEYVVPEQLIKLEPVVQGGDTWNQPQNPEKILECIYGESWRTPQKSKNWWDYTKKVVS